MKKILAMLPKRKAQKLNLKDLARMTCALEGGKINLSIAQVMEVQAKTFDVLYLPEVDPDQATKILYKLIENAKNRSIKKHKKGKK